MGNRGSGVSEPTKAQAAAMQKDVPAAETEMVQPRDDDGKFLDAVPTGRFMQAGPVKTSWGTYETHVYDGPDGCGYVIVMRTATGFEKRINYGPEKWRDGEWQAIDGI